MIDREAKGETSRGGRKTDLGSTDAIASQPAVGVQASLRSIWAANDLGTKQALLMGPSLLTTGFDMTGMEEGNAAFSSGKRIDPRTR